MPVTTGNKIASLIGADQGEVVMHQNVSVCVSLILSALNYRSSRNRILYVDVEFPTVIYVLEAQRKHGAEVVCIPSPDGLEVPIEKLIDAIDERTLIVPISYVFFKTSTRIDIERLVKRVHDFGAYVLLDAYQATGVVPIDVKKWDIDFLVGGSVKWLCGGPGAGYLYVKPSLNIHLRLKLVRSNMRTIACDSYMAHRKFQFCMPPSQAMTLSIVPVLIGFGRNRCNKLLA